MKRKRTNHQQPSNKQDEDPGEESVKRFRPRLPARPAINDLPALSDRLRELRYHVPVGCKRVPWIETLCLSSIFHEPPRWARREKARTRRLQASRRLFTNLPVDKEQDDDKKDDQTREQPKEQQEDLDAMDISREAQFVKAAEEAAVEGMRRLQALGVPFTRPNDFMASMLKSDAHMLRVRNKIADEQQRIETVENRRRQKFDRKFNKQAKKKQHSSVRKTPVVLLDKMKTL